MSDNLSFPFGMTYFYHKLCFSSGPDWDDDSEGGAPANGDGGDGDSPVAGPSNGNLSFMPFRPVMFY